MNDLYRAVLMITSGQITGEQTIFIDEALCNANCTDIPSVSVPNIIEYIDLQLAHNSVDQDTAKRLHVLHAELQSFQEKV